MIALIAAVAKNGVIGKAGKIPWQIPGEQTRFRECTTGQVVIMGRRTFLEIGHPLPNRETILISGTLSVETENCTTVATLQEALALAGGRDVWIAGGEQLYREALPIADALYLTDIDLEIEGDRCFPAFDASEFVMTEEVPVAGEVPYTYRTYVRKPLSMPAIRQQLQEIQKQSGIVLGLDTMRALMMRLGNVQNRLPVLHIAGTNGKGSTGAMLRGVLQKAGYRVGHYASPAVFDPMECWTINGRAISETAYCTWMTRLLRHRAAMREHGLPAPTVFELETALAFCYFAEEACDLVVLECGMGGAEDATNVVESTLVSLLTAIGLDHTGFLGEDLAAITRVKCGILKPGVPVVLQGQNTEILEQVAALCAEKHCPLLCTEPKEMKLSVSQNGTILTYRNQTWQLGLFGTFQGYNAIQVIDTVALLRKMGYPISEEALRYGLAHTIWPGRMEKLQDRPAIYLDGAHNPNAASQLRDTICQMRESGFSGKLYLILGVLADKDFTQVAAQLCPLAAAVFTVTPSNPRALSAQALAETVRPYCPNVTAGTIAQALDAALAAAGAEDIILACGSLSYLQEVRSQWEQRGGAV